MHIRNFPYENPYDIQIELMNDLYKLLSNTENNAAEKHLIEQDGTSIGIFESPTGTGKSLSLICAVLSWYEDFIVNGKSYLKKENCCKENNVKLSNDENIPDWLIEAKNQQKLAEEECHLNDLRKQRSDQREYLDKLSNLEKSLKFELEQTDDSVKEVEEPIKVSNTLV